MKKKNLKGRGDEEIVEHVNCRPYANAPDLPVSSPAKLAANAIKGTPCTDVLSVLFKL
jgi:hypothetical protein